MGGMLLETWVNSGQSPRKTTWFLNRSAEKALSMEKLFHLYMWQTPSSQIADYADILFRDGHHICLVSVTSFTLYYSRIKY